MSYQERIYSQNGKCDRNFAGSVLNTSSDICIFKRPSFVMSGASSIYCPEVTCSISGVPYNNLFTGTTDCFETNALSGSCFNSIDWTTNVYEDNVLVYSNSFYKSLSLTGSVIDIATFSGSVVTAFDTLGYDYSFDNEEFTIDKGLNFSNVKLELMTELDYDTGCQVTGNTTGFTSCSCPAGYTSTTANDICKKITTTASTYNGNTFNSIAGDTNSGYAASGAHFWPSLDELTLPLYRHGGPANTLHQGSTGGPVVTSVSNISNDFWGRFVSGNDSFGRLNNGVGVKTSNTSTEWVGFSKCINIPTTGTYYIGIAGDQYFKFRLNGEEILLGYTMNNGFNWGVWHMIPVTLYSGLNIIEMEGKNAGSYMSFGAEIYSETRENLMAATSISETGLIFTTNDQIGFDFQLGTTVGYTCPSGYSLNTCSGGTPVCTLIEETPITCIFTGSCETNQTICDLDFTGMTLNNSNVHLLTGQTEFDLSFEFTANTESFNETNALFKYDIYKFSPELGYFPNQPVYSSEFLKWDSISGTSAYTTSITASSINPDGQYIVKGQYTHDVCTEFATLLGYNYSTAISGAGGEIYGQYQPTRDFYFVALNKADEPTLNSANNQDGGTVGSLTVDSIVLDGTLTEFRLPFTNGDMLIALNGLTLSPNLDYSFNNIGENDGEFSLITLSADTINGDILTFTYSNKSVDSNSITSNVFDIDTTIVSGSTNGEGSNSVYFNTDTSKYEIFLSMTPVDGNDIGITLNGATLANSIDYYQSTSNPKRVILSGDIIVNDIINAYYNTNTNVQGNQFGTTMLVNWTIPNAPIDTNGLFTVEVASDTNFTTIISSATTVYDIGSTAYAANINLVGNLGDKQYYRVKNEKKFNTLCNETLTTSAYSENVEITIQTNQNNAY